jgi:hypothetical protein
MTDPPTDRTPTDPAPTTPYDPPPAAVAAPPPVDEPALPSPPPPPVAPPSPPPESSWQRGVDPGTGWGSIVFGIVLVAIGLWFFAGVTLGLEMPDLQWRDLWPFIIVAIGGWIVLSSMRRPSR